MTPEDEAAAFDRIERRLSSLEDALEDIREDWALIRDDGPSDGAVA